MTVSQRGSHRRQAAGPSRLPHLRGPAGRRLLGTALQPLHRRGARSVVAAVAAIALTLLAALVPALAGGHAAAAATAPSVAVKGNRLVTADGRPLRLLGVDRAGTEYACVQGWGIFEGPVDATAISAMAGWGANAVRVPLNEDCWLGINGVSASYSGANYRNAIVSYVSRLQAAGLVAVLDLHWSAPGTTKATGQQLMADADHSPAFWRSVAATFVNNSGVAFDLYNEPHGISWSCWRDGCTTSAGWKAAGMQSLVDAVRSTGARQPVLVGGLNWAGDLSQWTAYRPTDSAGQLVASAHIYNFSQCNTSSCWDSSIGKVASSYPVVTGELGENDCATGFVTSYMNWADAHGVGYLGWTWNTWGCGSGPALITAWDGTPTAFGVAVRDRLRALAAAPVSSSSAPVSSTTSVTSTPAASTTSVTSTSAAPTTTAPTTSSPTTATSTATSSTATTTSTATASPGALLVQGFESGTGTWKPETSTASGAWSTTAHQGLHGYSLTLPAMTASTAVLRANDGGNTLSPSNGGLLTAWIYLPAGAPGSSWRADLELQDSQWHWVAGTSVVLKPGAWTQVSIRPSSSLWSGHKDLGVQILSTQTGQAPLTVVVDDVDQSV